MLYLYYSYLDLDLCDLGLDQGACLTYVLGDYLNVKAPSQSSALSLQYRPMCNPFFFVTYDLENAQIVPKVHSLRLRSRLYQDT